MNKIVITSGKKYIDIDAYAGCIAYSKLLNSLNYNSIAYSSAIKNESICESILNLGFGFDDYKRKDTDEFIILDVSNHDMFDDIVNNDKIIEIIDHHTGYENYWKERNIKSKIEFIGSVCTIIFEKYCEYNKLELLNNKLCKLLIAGILDNTLNLKASITTQRDIDAYNKLIIIGNVENSWPDEYFLSCQRKIGEDLKTSIMNDLKIEYINELLPEVFGQLLIFDIKSILKEKDIIDETLNKYAKDWIINLISIEDGKSYIYTKSKLVEDKLYNLFNKKVEDNTLILEKFMLRKEIIKLARELNEKRRIKMIDRELNLELKEEFTPIVDLIKDIIKDENLDNANITCFVPHEVSSLVYIGWETGLLEDLKECLSYLLPENKWKNHDEPNTPFRYNFYEHMRSKLIGNTTTTLIVKNGELYLGTYQNIYFYSPVYKNIPNQKIFLRIVKF